jgi:hypothetical protein
MATPATALTAIPHRTATAAAVRVVHPHSTVNCQ